MKAQRTKSILGMGWILFPIAMLFAAAAAELESVTWETDYGEAIRMARQRKVPVLLEFNATWCGPCRAMEKTTLKDMSVVEKLNSFVKVSIDIDKNPALAKQFSISGVPAFIMLGSGGDEIDRTSGAAPAAEFSQWLNSGLSVAALSAAREQLFQEEKQRLAAQIHTADAALKAELIARLFDYRFRKENYYQDFAAQHLKLAAQEAPGLFLPYLNHERLSIRILAGNLLREQFGEAFVFDPWEKAEARLVIIEMWKKKVRK